jgi:RNA polymerase sigma-70 factor (ECF subfamily)
MPLAPSLRETMLGVVPSLRAFAMSLCGNVDRADDLVQETLLRAIANINSFEPGTNMSAWLFTILRNLFRSEYRKRRREVEDGDGRYADSLKSHPEQPGRIEFEELREALAWSVIARSRTFFATGCANAQGCTSSVNQSVGNSWPMPPAFALR